ncbi:hypothetical protein HW450_11960 [Corynebacterium hindlerae]|uniref:Uncharacterized protein n=1 Tax=Corynebacterium hindlerae TaxID=699041 RepID=A0A7G5FEI9_9CORY|nr:hypothetical protein [Corynebacterium hindlerae]QMV85030.1 hypothetical protein HW450_11960 [Corynebacterium hindlerae]QTH59073.1 hypothetical protein J5O04_09700 [Corynebacterium hindlerae]
MTVLTLILALAAFAAFVAGAATGDVMWYMLVVIFAITGLIVWVMDLRSKK